MKVVCINNDNLITPPDSQLLTVGKIYHVNRVLSEGEDTNSLYFLIDDTGKENFYRSDRFLLLRDINLGNLGI